jgi:hypothetical protein
MTARGFIGLARLATFIAIAGATLASPAAAQDTASLAVVVLPADTPVLLRLQETVSSATGRNGDTFTLVVTDDIRVDDRLVIPAGAVAQGEVIHAARSGIFGKAGELSMTSRFVTVGARRIRLRSLLAAAGETRADLAAGVGLVIPFAPFFIRGRDLVVPADTVLVARVAADEVFEFGPTMTHQPESTE